MKKVDVRDAEGQARRRRLVRTVFGVAALAAPIAAWVEYRSTGCWKLHLWKGHPAVCGEEAVGYATKITFVFLGLAFYALWSGRRVRAER